MRSNIVEWHLKRAPLVLLLARLLNKEGCYFHFLSRRLSYFSYIVWSYVLVITFGFFIFILSESKYVRFSGDSNKKKIWFNFVCRNFKTLSNDKYFLIGILNSQIDKYRKKDKKPKFLRSTSESPPIFWSTVVVLFHFHLKKTLFLRKNCCLSSALN